MIIAEPTDAQVADVIAINHLAASYAEAVSRLQIEEAVDTYAVDGVLASPTTDDAVGRAAIVSVISTTTASLEFVFQTVHAGLVSVDGDRASSAVSRHRVVAAETRWGHHAVPGSVRR